MASETRAPATSKNPNRDIYRAYISPKSHMASETRAAATEKNPDRDSYTGPTFDQIAHGKLGRPRRRKTPIAISIGPIFPQKSHMASETRAVATSKNPDRDIYRVRISPKIAHGVGNRAAASKNTNRDGYTAKIPTRNRAWRRKLGLSRRRKSQSR